MTKSLLGVNLEGLSYWCHFPLYADVIKTSQVFLRNLDNSICPVDSNGWPIDDCNFLLFTDLPHPEGTYKLSCTGKCDITLTATNAKLQNLVYNAATNQTTADIVHPVDTLRQIGIRFSNTNGGPKNIQCIRPGCTADQLFNPAALNLIKPFGLMRFMDFLTTVGNPLVNWSDRPTPATPQFTLGKGGPYEHAIELGRQTGKDIWINVPVGASDDFINNLAALVRKLLPAGLFCYVEFSNEVWNYGFPEWKTNFDAAQLEAKTDTTLTLDGTSFDVNLISYRRVAKKLLQISKAFKAAFADLPASQYPIRPVLAGQCGNPLITQTHLEYINRYSPKVSDYVYATAIAPYFGCDEALKGSTTLTVDQLCNNLLQNANVMTWIPNGATYINQHLSLAKQYNIQCMSYEGGEDLGQQNVCVDVKTQAQSDSRTGQAVYNYLKSWFVANPTGQFCYFTLTSPYTQWGYWGLTDDPSNTATPKYSQASLIAQQYPDGIILNPDNSSSSAPAVALGNNFKINCGDPTDWLVSTFLGDKGFVGGTAFDRGNIAIANTSNPKLYQTERFGMTAYAFAVDSASYEVTLRFAETYDGITDKGQRVFDVTLNGQTILADFDPFAEAGGRNIAIKKTFKVQVFEGLIVIGFIPKVQNTLINGIEVTKLNYQKPKLIKLIYPDGSVVSYDAEVPVQ